MRRAIYCPTCAQRPDLMPVDVAYGWRSRRTPITVRKPENLTVDVYEITERKKTLLEHKELEHVHCDGCDGILLDGTAAFAVTLWKNTEPTPPDWEKEYTQ